MNLDEIRQFIEEEGGKFIIVENGKPVMVITSFEEYKKRIKKKPIAHPISVQSQLLSSLPKELQEDELKIEDLPF